MDWKRSPVTGAIAGVVLIGVVCFFVWYAFLRRGGAVIMAEPDVTYMCRYCAKVYIVRPEGSEGGETVTTDDSEDTETEESESDEELKLGRAKRDPRGRRCFDCPACSKLTCVYRAITCTRCKKHYLKPSLFRAKSARAKRPKKTQGLCDPCVKVVTKPIRYNR